MSTCCYTDFIDAAEICGGALAGAWDGTQWAGVTSDPGSYPVASFSAAYFTEPTLTISDNPVECNAGDFPWPPGDSPEGGEPSETNNAIVLGDNTFVYTQTLQGLARLTSGIDVGDTVDWSYEVIQVAPAQSAANYTITLTPQPDGVSALFGYQTESGILFYREFGGCITSPGCAGTFAITINITASVAGKGDVVFNLYFYDAYLCF